MITSCGSVMIAPLAFGLAGAAFGNRPALVRCFAWRLRSLTDLDWRLHRGRIAGEGLPREHHPVGHQHVVGIELAPQHAVDVGQVAEAEPGVLVLGAEHDQHAAVDLELPQSGHRLLGARLVELPLGEHDHLAVGRPVGERRAQGELHHLLGGALAVAAGLGAEGDAATAPLGRVGGTLSGAARPLLAPRLGATAGHLGPGLGALVSAPAGGELGRDHLVHNGNIGLDAEHGLVQLHRTGLLAGLIADVDFAHASRPSFPTTAFTALRMSTSPPLGPGTAPFTSSRLRSGSAWTTSRLRVVTRSPPMRPAILVPLNTREGVAQAPMAPGERCLRSTPWLAFRPLKPWRFMTPAKPLPLLTAVTSTFSPASRMSTAIS